MRTPMQVSDVQKSDLIIQRAVTFALLTLAATLVTAALGLYV